MGRKKYVQLKSLIDNTSDSKILTDIDPMLPIVNTFEYILQFKKKNRQFHYLLQSFEKHCLFSPINN